MKRCPLCERPWLENQSKPPLWQKLERYADGTRSYKELAQLAGSTCNSVAVALTRMRREGIEVRGRAGKTPEYVPVRQEYERVRGLRLQGLSWKQIGRQLGMPESSAYKRGKQLEAAFGALPGSRTFRRDMARDYIRIRELRVDAQLPWKLVGASLGMNGTYVARYFSELCKVYGN